MQPVDRITNRTLLGLAYLHGMKIKSVEFNADGNAILTRRNGKTTTIEIPQAFKQVVDEAMKGAA